MNGVSMTKAGQAELTSVETSKWRRAHSPEIPNYSNARYAVGCDRGSFVQAHSAKQVSVDLVFGSIDLEVLPGAGHVARPLQCNRIIDGSGKGKVRCAKRHRNWIGENPILRPM